MAYVTGIPTPVNHHPARNSLTGDLERLMQRYVSERTEAAAERVLQEILERFAVTLVRKSVARIGNRIRSVGFEDEEDLRSEILISLIGRIRRWRQEGFTQIGSLSAYAEQVAKNAALTQSNKDRPLHAKLAANIRYALKSTPTLALWTSDSGQAIGGLEEWCGQQACGSSEALRTILENPRLLGGDSQGCPSGMRRSLIELFEFVGHPLPLTTIVSLLARAQGLTEGPPTRDSEFGEGSRIERQVDPGIDAQTSVEQRDALRSLWEAIHDLPLLQRAALLLNLRDHLGRGVLGLLPVTGVATKVEISAAVGLPLAELEQRWDSLPMDDATIAARFGLVPSRVIGLRRSARERLSRALAA